MDEYTRKRIDLDVDKNLELANSSDGQKKILEALALEKAKCDRRTREITPSYGLMKEIY